MVSATSDQVTTPVTASVTTFVTYFYGLDITKTGRIVDDGDGFAGPGDTIEYSFVVTNSGNVTLNDVTPRDPGPSFNGVADAVVNTADAVGFHASGIIVSSPSTVALTLPGQASDVSFVKQALVDTIRRGEVEGGQ